jgi:(R)-citramalate synthase
MMRKKIEIMDTTLRDGEQMPGANYSPEWKLRIVQALASAGVDRIEVCSARGFSTKEHGMLKMVMEWARENGLEEKIEVLTFVDGQVSVNWVRSAGGAAINVLCKGSKIHCEVQLKKDVQGHIQDIRETVAYAVSCGIKVVNVYLEDWSQGMAESEDYVRELLSGIKDLPIERFMLCDTLGTLSYWKTEEYVKKILEWFPGIKLDFHGHNDYGLSVANSLAAIRGGVQGIHVTINGLGERTGNAPLNEVVVNIRDHLGDNFLVGVRDDSLRSLSWTAALMTGKRVAPNKPISGKDVFSNTAGVHADGDRKGKLYEHPKLKPQRFGAQIKHPMGKLSGRANILQNLDRLGLKLSKGEVDLILKEVVRISENGRSVSMADLPYIVSIVLNRPDHVVFEVVDVESHTYNRRRPLTAITARYLDKEYQLYSQGTGGFDAFMLALHKLPRKASGVVVPRLRDFNVQIPPGSGTDALVEVIIEWEAPTVNGPFQTRGYHVDQVLASFLAAEAAMNLCNCVVANGGK